MLMETGFKAVAVEDLINEVMPLKTPFDVPGAVPYNMLNLFGLHTELTNIMAGVEARRHWRQGRYIFDAGSKGRRLLRCLMILRSMDSSLLEIP